MKRNIIEQRMYDRFKHTVKSGKIVVISAEEKVKQMGTWYNWNKFGVFEK